jgi:hypothetical protein
MRWVFTVWNHLNLNSQFDDAAELSALLKVMVMLDDASENFIEELAPQHRGLCKRGRQYRAQLPAYLEQHKADIVAQCPLPTVLQALVITYAATTLEDMWTDGLRL